MPERDSARDPQTAAPAAVLEAPASAPERPAPVPPQAGAPLAPSLAGSVPDGEITLDGQGRLVRDEGLRRLFDHFLSTIGERDVGEIRAALAAHVDATQAGAVVGDVLAAFDRYVAYQQALAGLDPGAIADLAERHARVKALRRSILGDAFADGFFAAEEAYADYTIERMRVAGDTTLTTEQRATRLAELEAAQPAAQRAARAAATTAVLADEQSRQFDALGTDPATRHAERSALWGAEAADRLAALDAARDAWDARVATYVRQRAALRNDRALDAATRARRESALLDASFTEPERRRVQSLDDAGLLPPGG